VSTARRRQSDQRRSPLIAPPRASSLSQPHRTPGLSDRSTLASAASAAIVRTVPGPVANLVLGSLAASLGVRGLPACLVLGGLAASLGVRGLPACLVLGGLAEYRTLRRLSTGIILGGTARFSC
jgi:hypothetical protein